jgi:hypothetical protein
MSMRRPIKYLVLTFIGALAPSGSFPATRMLAMKLSKELCRGGEGYRLDGVSSTIFRVLFV